MKASRSVATKLDTPAALGANGLYVETYRAFLAVWPCRATGTFYKSHSLRLSHMRAFLGSYSDRILMLINTAPPSIDISNEWS